MEKKTVHYIQWVMYLRDDLPNLWTAGLNAGQIRDLVICQMPPKAFDEGGTVHLGVGFICIQISPEFEIDVDKAIVDLKNIVVTS